MVDTAHAMDFPLMAGSSLPVTWRMPAIDMPENAGIEEGCGLSPWGAWIVMTFTRWR